MFHRNHKPYSNKELEKIFYESGFRIAPIEVDLIRQFSQLNKVVSIKVKKTFNNAIIDFNSDNNDIYYYLIDYYSSISYEEIDRRFKSFIFNMTFDDYKYMYDNGYLSALAQFDFIPSYVYDAFHNNEGFYPPLIYDAGDVHNLECFAKLAYAYLKVAQYKEYFGFEVKEKGDIILSCGL
jgi:hypothetical protein